MDRFAGKVVLVTGGAQGIGAAVARGLVKEGAHVAVGDVLPPEQWELEEDVLPLRLDVTSPLSWQEAVRCVVATFGGLDVLVNNAGVSHIAPIGKHPVDQWERVLAVNLTGAFHGIQAAIPDMRRRSGGSIVNVSSTAGFRGFRSAPGYTAAKFGLRGLTRSAALDLGADGIRVNSVHPGFVRTPATEGVVPEPSMLVLGRTATPAEAAAVVLWLASDEASFVTGAEYAVDGGETA